MVRRPESEALRHHFTPMTFPKLTLNSYLTLPDEWQAKGPVNAIAKHPNAATD